MAESFSYKLWWKAILAFLNLYPVKAIEKCSVYDCSFGVSFVIVFLRFDTLHMLADENAAFGQL